MIELEFLGVYIIYSCVEFVIYLDVIFIFLFIFVDVVRVVLEGEGNLS